jgi:hypothetical protein
MELVSPLNVLSDEPSQRDRRPIHTSKRQTKRL